MRMKSPCTEHIEDCCHINSERNRYRYLTWAVALTAVVLVSFASLQAATISFIADPINSANEPAPNCNNSTLPGTGIGVFNLDDVTHVVIGKVIYSNLQSPETAAHVHGPAPVCVNAGVLFPLPAGTPKNFTYTMTSAQQADMLAGRHYANIHTQAAPGGQIRGQIVRNTLVTGACCTKGFTECLVTDVGHCQQLGGTYGGDGTTCTGNQACCLSTGCVNVDPICCAAQGGIPRGAGSSCTQANICACGPDNLQPTRCLPVQCPTAGDTCKPKCVNYNPQTGQSTVISCQCGPDTLCHAVIPGTTGFTAGTRGGGNPCVVTDNGSGTITLPPAGCAYLSPSEVHQILDGLPVTNPPTTIHFAPIHTSFICGQGSAGTPCSTPIPPGLCEDNGGDLNGKHDCFGSTLNMQLTGTGALAGWNRTVSVQVACEVSTAPRTPGQPVQSFDTEMFRLQGQLPAGDPDFDLLRITAGNGFGLPSPGHTTLTQIPGGNWSVDSFFDITYRIDFVGHAGGHVGGMSGSTTATIRMATGNGPSCQGSCPPGQICNEARTVRADGTIDICCNCIDQTCGPDPTNPTECLPVTCPNPNQQCQPKCVRFNPQTGQSSVLACECRDPNACHVVVPVPGTGGTGGLRGSGNPCVVPNTGGTVSLPPTGCAYLSPSQVHEIVNGLPAGTTINLAPIHQDFICHQPGGSAICSFTSANCKQNGGDLGGEKECADSTLQFNAQGTGSLSGYSRSLPIPISFETHVAPRNVGAQVQSFDTEMFRLQGQLPPGDPDFDLLRVTAGNDFGLPSPGHTTLTMLPGGGNFAVDSFFDITYRIDFIGHSPGPLGGMSGSTTGTIRMATGTGPSCSGNCPPGTVCQETRTVNADGTVDVCCNCVTAPCGPDPANPTRCAQVACAVAGQICQPRCARFNPTTGQSVVTSCECGDDTECHVFVPAQGALTRGGGNPCVVPDTGGTVVLPPAGCGYLSPADVHEIINGLPAGTTIQIGVQHQDFICPSGGPVPICTFPTQGTRCTNPGGSLGGEQECSLSSVNLSMQGTGSLSGYSRSVSMQVGMETEVGPRVLGQPVQSFDTDMFRLQGQLPPGDPDFDLLRVTAGNDFGLPSPGHTTLTRLPGGTQWAVDSFFDITYRIDFIGHSPGPLGGMSGSTTGTIRMATGTGPSCIGGCPQGFNCLQGRTVNADGTIDVCCRCVRPCQCPGDLNLDCKLNAADIQLFVNCLLRSPQPNPLDHPCNCADMNGDGLVTLADVPPFVAQLLAFPKAQCPTSCVPGMLSE